MRLDAGVAVRQFGGRAVAQGIRGTEVVATDEAASTLDAAALVRAAQCAPKKR
jgi:hypothetical protein